MYHRFDQAIDIDNLIRMRQKSHGNVISSPHDGFIIVFIQGSYMIITGKFISIDKCIASA